ncbi:hypothetical protein R3P38DRAFT_3239932 [Favolaschia claudopus]|uniref:F-box domain-containing protein n=1 Tax=Favolaschia claudopus TaxID=2862362 RepID=A0AAV9Z7R3_9AGAR
MDPLGEAEVLALLRDSASRVIEKSLSSFSNTVVRRVLDLADFRPAVLGSVGRCPMEVFTPVFRVVLGALDPLTPYFRKQRARLALVCRFWNQVVVADLSLWSNLFLTPDTEGEVVDRLLFITRQHPLSVYLVDQARSTQYVGRERRLAMLAVFDRVLSSSQRWVSLEVVCSSSYAQKAMLDQLDSGACPLLRCLVVRSPNRAAAMVPNPVAVTVYPRSLRRLVLHRCNFPDTFPDSFPDLRVLSLSDLPTLHSPTQDQLFELLRRSPVLVRLELVRIGIRVYPDIPQPTILDVDLPSVSTLVLAFNVSLHPARSFFRILCHMRFPNLEHLHLGLPTDGDLKHYLGARSLFRAPSISLAGRFSESVTLSLLLATFVRVVSLDIVDADQPAIVRHLGSFNGIGSRSTILVLPALTRLRVRPLHWEVLRQMLHFRHDGGSAVSTLELVPHEGFTVRKTAESASALASIALVVHRVVRTAYQQYETHEVLRCNDWSFLRVISGYFKSSAALNNPTTRHDYSLTRLSIGSQYLCW